MTCLREPNAEPIPGYRLLEPLGSGGFGEVWKCEAPGGLCKAMKFVYGNLNSVDMEGVRAEQELQALRRIKDVRHPFVLSLDRIEVVDGELVIVMELADRSLHDAYVECQSAGMVGIPHDVLLRHMRDAAEALDHMNEKHNLQHLDIKPRNLFLISDRVKVADFGLVKHLDRAGESGLLGGVTPLYAPPETFHGKITQHTDQYSLAIVYQELLTGQRPFHGSNVRQLAQQHLQGDPDLRPLPEAERAIVARALAKDPNKRFPSCLAFVRALFAAHTWARPDPVNFEPDDVPQSEPVRVSANDSQPAQGESAAEDADIARLGSTVAQPQSGALRPTVLVGLGGFGRRAVRELRCRLLDRFGDLGRIPLFRFLYVDPDTEAIQDALRGAPDVAFSQNEVYYLPLQAVGHYRRRMLDHLAEWLPREKLYSIPRSLQTHGSRALGRLAYVDNHVRFLARLRRELQRATHPETLYRSVSQTGLALRQPSPRIYVIASAGGGSSGALVDLGYSLRRLLQQLRQPEADVTLLLFCGAPSDPATPKSERANVYATLTELNHFADPAIPFAAQYGPDGPRIVEQCAPYHCTYLLQQSHRGPQMFRDTVAHLGSYLFHELTTPLGSRLDRSRQLPPPIGATPFRSFGTHAVWFPRGLLLRLAGRQACLRLIGEWQAEGEPTASAELEAACARVLADAALQAESITPQVEESARTVLGGSPSEVMTGFLASLEEQSLQAIAQDDPGNWAKQALGRVQDWIGVYSSGRADEAENGALNGDWRKSRYSRSLAAGAQRLAEDWDKRLMEVAFRIMENPGRRIASVEGAVDRFLGFCSEGAATFRTRWHEQAARIQKAWMEVETALENCLTETGGRSWGLGSILGLGTQSRRSLRVFVDLLAAFARQCLVGETLSACQSFFTLLRGRLEDRKQELSFCRQRLRHMRESLASKLDEVAELDINRLNGAITPGHSPPPSPEGFWDSIRQSATVRVVLPQNEVDLERVAMHFADNLTPERLAEVDQALQDRVLGQLGGLHAICSGSSDLIRHLGLPLVNHAADFLGSQLPVTDVAQVELADAMKEDRDISSQIQDYWTQAAPLVAAADASHQEAFLLIPASDAGKAYGEHARQAVRSVELVRVPGQAHLMFCCEQASLAMDDLQRLLQTCRPAYEEAAFAPPASPHARFDITDWTPLDP
jgi:hypothetical protein